MSFVSRLAVRTVAVAALAGAAAVAQAEGFSADYSLALQAGHSWFGQLGLAQAPVSPLLHSGTNDVMNVAGGYHWSNGQSLSLQLSRGRGPGQRLGLAVNYDWPRYFVRFSYDPPGGPTLSPQDSLRFSAGVRF